MIETKPGAAGLVGPHNEKRLIERAVAALTECRWTVGECAAEWTKAASGRTDADFGLAIGLSGDQVWRMRRVWERFGGDDSAPVRNLDLAWSHYLIVLTYENANDALHWAADSGANVAEFRVWVRMQRGDELAGDRSPAGITPAELLPVIGGDGATLGETAADATIAALTPTDRDPAEQTGRETTSATSFRDDALKPQAADDPPTSKAVDIDKAWRTGLTTILTTANRMSKVRPEYRYGLADALDHLAEQFRQGDEQATNLDAATLAAIMRGAE